MIRSPRTASHRSPRQDGAARIGAVDMGRCDVAGGIDRDRGPHGGGHLQPAAETRIGQQDALPVGELDGRDVGALGDRFDALEKGAIVLPAPMAGQGLELVGGNASALCQLPGSGCATGVAEPGTLGRGVELGTHPDVQPSGIGIERVHQLAGIDGRFGRLGLAFGGNGHGVSPCSRVWPNDRLAVRPVTAGSGRRALIRIKTHPQRADTLISSG